MKFPIKVTLIKIVTHETFTDITTHNKLTDRLPTNYQEGNYFTSAKEGGGAYSSVPIPLNCKWRWTANKNRISGSRFRKPREIRHPSVSLEYLAGRRFFMSHSSHVPTHHPLSLPSSFPPTSAVRKRGEKSGRKGTEETGVRTFNTRPLQTFRFLFAVEACLSRLHPRISIEIGPNATRPFQRMRYLEIRNGCCGPSACRQNFRTRSYISFWILLFARGEKNMLVRRNLNVELKNYLLYGKNIFIYKTVIEVFKRMN